MLLIKLKDNDYTGSPLKIFRDFSDSNSFDFANLSEAEKQIVRKALDSVDNVSLKELETRGAIIFPSKSAKYDLDDDKKIVLSVQNLEGETPLVKTFNVMGFFSLAGGVELQITSRFDSNEKNYFLHYMLQKICNASPTIELTSTKQNPFYEFIVYLFPQFFKSAVSQGLFRAYIKKEYNDSNLRGVIDFPRHFKNNIPFNGKIAYRTREYSSDNFLTQLVRHTIEYISENQNLRSILTLDEETKSAVEKIRESTVSYKKMQRDFIIAKNLNPVSHPFYTEYENLRKLCICILTHEKISYGENKENQFNGILFDGAYLWEEYLNVILKENAGQLDLRIEHPNNRATSGGKFLFRTVDKSQKGLIFPDFIVQTKTDNKAIAILDAKYKNLVKGTDNSDYFQILSYMFRFECKRGVLIFPKPGASSEENLYLINDNDKTNSEICFSLYGFEIPVYDSECEFKQFASIMMDSEDKLCKEKMVFDGNGR